MKIPVYDKTNKSRLLGHLDVCDTAIRGCRYNVAVMSPPSTWSIYEAPHAYDRPSNIKHVAFDIDFRSDSKSRQIDAATREITTVERKVFLTYEPLANLMKIDKFTLPDESGPAAARRRRDGSYYSDDY